MKIKNSRFLISFTPKTRKKKFKLHSCKALKLNVFQKSYKIRVGLGKSDNVVHEKVAYSYLKKQLLFRFKSLVAEENSEYFFHLPKLI